MTGSVSFTLPALAAAYAETGNVHKAAARLGVSHSRAHRP